MLLTKRHGAIFFDKFKTVINDVSGFWIQSLSKVDSESEIFFFSCGFLSF